MRGVAIEGRLRLVPKEDTAPPAPGFVYTPPPLAGLRWNPRRGRFNRGKRVLLVAAISLAAWGLLCCSAKVLL